MNRCTLCQVSFLNYFVAPSGRDVNAAINIKHLAVGIPVNKAYRVSEAIAGVGKKPPLEPVSA